MATNPGTDQQDVIFGTDTTDTLSGGFSSDRIFGYSDNDVLSGGFQGDGLNGDNGNDSISGGSGRRHHSGGDRSRYDRCRHGRRPSDSFAD
ncbi:calcium-binding protein [Sinorhizobium fredii]|uniref:calcium-binding protein n=1 Tax=Rhizobium fredii TaxID=380 RepID=UPI0035165C61